MTYLSRDMVAIGDYWRSCFDHLPHSPPFSCFEVVAGCWITPTCVYADTTKSLYAKTLVFPMTNGSIARLLDQLDDRGRTMADVIHAWQTEFDITAEQQCMALSMPIPHALLVANRIWTAYSLPKITGRGWGSQGFNYIPLLVSPAGPVEEADALPMAFGPEQLQDVCNLIRRLVDGDDTLADEAKTHVLSLDRQRRALLHVAEKRLTLAYDMVFMVQCMVLSGLLIDVADLRSAVLLSVNLALGRDPIIIDFFENLLQKPKSLPGHSTIYRHRLTLHIAFCKVQQQKLSAMLGDRRYSGMGDPRRQPSMWLGLHTFRIHLDGVIGLGTGIPVFSRTV